jgi:two-component system response regulator YesN
MHGVVIVEDEEYLRRELVLTTPWADVGCAVVGEAGDGIEGERLIVQGQPDIVLTDLRLPGQDGLAMLEHALPRHAIVFSGYNDAHLMQQAIRIGVDDYLFKPVDDEELVRSLRKVAATLGAEGPVPPRPADAIPRFPLSPLPRRFGLHRVDAAVAFIERNYQNAVGLKETADALGLSENYLSRLFHKTTGLPFLGYVTRFRIARALEFLADPRLGIAEVCTRCGFRSGSHFAQVFRHYMGDSPARYRNRGP